MLDDIWYMGYIWDVKKLNAILWCEDIRSKMLLLEYGCLLYNQSWEEGMDKYIEIYQTFKYIQTVVCAMLVG